MGGSVRSSLTTPRRAACKSNLNKSYFAFHVFLGNLRFSPLKEIRDNTVLKTRTFLPCELLFLCLCFLTQVFRVVLSCSVLTLVPEPEG